MIDPNALAELATLRGIGEEYLDFRDEPRAVSAATRRAILAAMGVAVDSPEAVAAALGEAGRLQLVHAPAAPGETSGELPADGPSRCFEPDELAVGSRRFGVAVQLYTVRSAGNWGIGDFADLLELVQRAAAAGADFVGLNPLHALFTADPGHCSPYSASSRHALNALYIAVERAPGFASCAEARARVAEPAFQQELARLRAVPCVDYPGVARVKLPVLRSVYEHFRREHLEARSAEGLAFEAFVAERGETLRLHALFEAIDEVMRARREASGGWLSWPAAYRDPAGKVVAAFERAAAQRVGFHAWLQWVADLQLGAAATAARAAGMGIGLYGDYAVGVNPGGSEVWSRQQIYRLGAGVGAPPDALALKGQDWGIPPMDPLALMAEDYRPFAELMRDNMRHFGAVRLDHVMSLYRLWWVPHGMPATEGGYVRYPLDDLLGVVAAESRRNRCLVIGEDLGTVPREMSLAMRAFGVYHYKVLLFEKAAHGPFFPPEDWSRRAIGTISTHDLPTLASWWAGTDIELRARLGLYPDEETRARVTAERQADRDLLIDALAAAGLRPRWPVDRFEPQFAAAVHAFLGATRSSLVAVQAEDLLGMLDPVNVPGTSTEHPNWLRKLSADLAEVFDGPAAQPVLEALRRQRPR